MFDDFQSRHLSYISVYSVVEKVQNINCKGIYTWFVELTKRSQDIRKTVFMLCVCAVRTMQQKVKICEKRWKLGLFDGQEKMSEKHEAVSWFLKCFLRHRPLEYYIIAEENISHEKNTFSMNYTKSVSYLHD